MYNNNLLDTIKAIAVVVVFFLLFGIVGHYETHYTRKDCVVVSAHRGVVTVEDKCGYLWEYTAEGSVPAIGTHVNLRMHTNHTESIVYDDYILEVVES
jgi:hypothetical protein